MKLETQVCTTNPEVPPRKAEFPISTKLRIGGWGGPWVENIDYQHCKEIFYATSFSMQTCHPNRESISKRPKPGNERPLLTVIKGY